MISFAVQSSPRASNGKAFFVQQVLDQQNRINVLFRVQTMTGSSLVGLDLREFAFPETEHVLFQPGQLTDLADTVENPTLRQLRGRR
jgi:hypothetical protein